MRRLDMQLQPDTKSIAEIFPIDTDVLYTIPDYQRNYAWKEENIETLINDLNEERDGYYLGNFIVTESDNRNKFDIVDGQQRITTLALILLAIYQILGDQIDYDKNLREIKPQVLKRMYSKQTDIERKLFQADGEPQLQLLEPDNTIYRDLLKSIESIDYKHHKNRILGKRFKSTKDFLNSIFISGEEKDECLEHLLSFYDKLNNSEILRIRVPNLNDAFTVFTSFNAKGVPLTLIDLLKSYYLKEATTNLESNVAINKWEELISIFYDSNDEPNSSVVTQFIRNNYDTFESDTLSSITRNDALRKYEKLFVDKTHEYIDTLIIRAKIFSNINSNIQTSDILNLSNQTKKLLEKLDRLETTQIYPILMHLLGEYHKSKLTETILNDILEFLIIYFVRRNIVLKPKSSNIRAVVLTSVRELKKYSSINSENINVIREKLLEIAANDDEFKVALSGPVYDTSKNTLRIILIDLERRYGNEFFDKKQNPDNLEGVNDKGNYIWTLEHILPQSAVNNSHWSHVLNNPNFNDGNSRANHDQYVHKIGNITLTGYNSEMSTKSFVDKRDYKDKESNLETGLKTKLYLNKSLTDESENLDIKTDWTIEDIIRRTNTVVEEVIKLYQF